MTYALRGRGLKRCLILWIGRVKYGQQGSKIPKLCVRHSSIVPFPKGWIGSTWRPCNYGPNHPSALHSLKELMSAAPCVVFASCTNYLIRAPPNATDGRRNLRSPPKSQIWQCVAVLVGRGKIGPINFVHLSKMTRTSLKGTCSRCWFLDTQSSATRIELSLWKC